MPLGLGSDTATKRRHWVVLREGRRLRWGGDLRRHYIFSRLGDVAPTNFVHGWTTQVLSEAVGDSTAPPPLLASVELLNDDTLALAKARTRCAVLDLHDDPVRQLDAVGIPLEPARHTALVRMQQENLAAFEIHVTPSESLIELSGLDRSRTIVAPNGTDTRLITPGPWPITPRIAMASGAAPRRGIEELIEAARRLRPRFPDLELDLLLIATGEDSRVYLDQLREEVTADSWIRFASSKYQRFGALLSRASAICIPHPPNPYWEGIVPIKLVDAMAAGRPVVVTPRKEMKRLVERKRVGVVAADDSVDALAQALERLVADDAHARKLGARARKTAEREFDWSAISARLSRELAKRRW